MDGNKTALTHRVTAAACAYLDIRGFRPIETEVSVRRGWLADIASFVYPSMTELKNLKLVPNKYCEESTAAEIDYRYGYPLTAIVEVKTSQQDFKKDLQTKFAGHNYPAHLCYLAYPAGMIKIDELPAGWTGLETDKDGEKVLRRHPKNDWCHDLMHPQRPGDVTDLIAAVAMRRDNRTRYAVQREFVKAHNARENQREKTFKVTQIIYDFFDWMQQKGFYKDYSISEFLRMHGLKNIPHYLSEQAEKLSAMRQK